MARLAAKNEIIEKLKAITDDTDRTEAVALVRSLIAEWQNTVFFGEIGGVCIAHVFEILGFLCEKAVACLTKASKQGVVYFITDDTDRTEAVALVRSLIAEWQNTGHVPFKDKDKVYDAYKAVLDSLYDRFDIKETKANMSNFAQSINDIGNDENRLYRERERLVRTFEAKRNELKTYENNMGFFNVKSKDGNSLLRDMERKIQRIKDDLATLEEKIKLIDSKL